MRVQFCCSDLRYAVIQASSKKERPERLVIAYHDEQSLRDLIAAPSIIGLGSPRAKKRSRTAKATCQTLVRNQSLESQQCFTCLMRRSNWRVGTAW